MIEYLMIYIKSTLSIYGRGESLQAVEMGTTQFVFRKTTPSGISIAIGLSEKGDQKEAQEVFEAFKSSWRTSTAIPTGI